jgi:hypothetical protein
MGDAKQIATHLTDWVEKTTPQIAQKRYLAQLQAVPADQARLYAEAMTLELLAEEVQGWVRHYTTARQLRGAAQRTLEAMAHLPDPTQEPDEDEARAAWAAGRAQGYRAALEDLAAILAQAGGQPSE